MIFSPFYYFKTGCAAYVFGCGGLGLGAVVDPQADDIESYVSLADALCDVPAKPADMMDILRHNQGRTGV